MVSTAFPPSIGCGVQRIIRLCRGLSTIGFIPTVLTTDHKKIVDFTDDRFSDICAGVFRAPYTSIADRLRGLQPYKKKRADSSKDIIHLTEFVSNGDVKNLTLKSFIKDLFHGYLEFPDNANTWILPAISMGMEIGRTRKFDAIYSSSPRVSSHIVAAELSARLKIPWVMEFRDLWAGNPQTGLPQPWPRHSGELWLEKRLMQRASKISTVSEGSRAILIGRYGEEIGNKVLVFPHGFDRNERRSPLVAPQELPLTIAHTGYLYNGRRDITGLYRALECLITIRRVQKDEIVLRFAGDTDGYAKRSAVRYELSSAIVDYGYVPNTESLRLQESSHILLLVERAEDTDWVYSQMPGKVFEYLGARRPILALVNPASMIAEIIRSTNTGAVFAPDDVDGIANYLEEQVDCLKENSRLRFEPDEELLGRYNWANTIQRIGQELTKMIMDAQGIKFG